MTTTAEDALDFKEGMELLLSQGAIIALMPLEQWLQDLERSDAIGPILDPTLYREYLWSGRERMSKEVLSAAIHFKAAILKAQADVRAGKVR